MTVKSFEDRLKTDFPHYAEHIVLAWYLRNAKAECLSPSQVPANMMWMIADFAQNIQVVKRYDTAEEYFKRPEIALHGIISGFVPVDKEGTYEMSHVTSSNYKYIFYAIIRFVTQMIEDEGLPVCLLLC